MKIKAHITVEKIDLGYATTFRSEVHEVEVVRVYRSPVSLRHNLNRWYYQADIKDHPALHPEAIRVGANGAYRVNVMRRGLNGAWVPPEFPAGKNWVDVASPQAEKEGE